MATHKEKTEYDLVYDENKKAIRAAVKLQTDRMYARKTNKKIAEMTEDFERWKKEGRLLRILPKPTEDMSKFIESDEEMPALPKGE